jgi:hypothetical protein
MGAITLRVCAHAYARARARIGVPGGARPRGFIFISIAPAYKISDFPKTNSYTMYF